MPQIPFHTISPPLSPTRKCSAVFESSEFPSNMTNSLTPAVITQESEDCMDVDGESNHQIKRIRTKTWQSQMLRDTCLNLRSLKYQRKANLQEALNLNHEDPLKSGDIVVAKTSKKNCWWKQKSHNNTSPHPTNTIDDSRRESNCFVCQGAGFSSKSGTLRTQESKKQAKSILAYFGPVSSMASNCSSHIASKRKPSACSDTTNLVVCSFCDHAACKVCSRKCEVCHGQFCTFCSTINYNYCVERVFCIDCAANARPINASFQGMEM